MVGAAVLNRFAHLGVAPTLFLEYAAVTCVVWGLNAFLFRKLPLSGFTLLVFSAAVFGVLFFIAYLVREVAGPFLIDSAGRLVALVHLADLIFYVFAVMTVAGVAGCAFSADMLSSACSRLSRFFGG